MVIRILGTSQINANLSTAAGGVKAEVILAMAEDMAERDTNTANAKLSVSGVHERQPLRNLKTSMQGPDLTTVQCMRMTH